MMELGGARFATWFSAKNPFKNSKDYSGNWDQESYHELWFYVNVYADYDIWWFYLDWQIIELPISGMILIVGDWLNKEVRLFLEC